jgi:hypothetical protein
LVPFTDQLRLAVAAYLARFQGAPATTPNPAYAQHRAVATRYDKRDFIWRGTIDVASIRIWLGDPVP